LSLGYLSFGVPRIGENCLEKNDGILMYFGTCDPKTENEGIFGGDSTLPCRPLAVPGINGGG
jgi:hypothetical protein